jgi:hypothetical protein
VSLLVAGTGARVGGAGVIVVAGAGRASGREGCFLGELSSVGPERMLANDMGSAARACFVSLGGEAGRGSRIIDDEYPGAPFPPMGYSGSVSFFGGDCDRLSRRADGWA